MTIILSLNGKTPVKLNESGFEKEEELQKYILNNPEVIPVDKIDESKTLLILAREFQTSSGPIDAIGIDNDGDIYLIETKLYKNSDKRKVLAQILDYGSALWTDEDVDNFLNEINRVTYEQHNTTFDKKVTDFFKFNKDNFNELLNNIKSNFKLGKFKFVILMDTLTDSLKRLILYINQHSNFDVYAVEIKYYKSNNINIAVPDIFGAEISSSKNKSNKVKWNFDLFVKERLIHCGGKEIVDIVRKIIEFAKNNSIAISWTNSKRGSFVLKFKSDSKYVYLLSIHGNCAIEWNLPHQGTYAPEPFNDRDTQVKVLNKLAKDFKDYVNPNTPEKFNAVNIPLNTLKDKDKLNAFLDFLLFVKSLCL